MRLDALFPAEAAAGAATEIDGLAYDSRNVRPGTLFFCVPGQHSDGHDFAAQAVAAGAAALVAERPLDLGVPTVLVGSARDAMAGAAARFNGDPTVRLRVIGITGTNGKTTTAYMVRALMEAAGRRCGLLGTVKSVVGARERPAVRTTPEAIDLQADFAEMLRGGQAAAAMEVSSHALQLRRVRGVRFAAAIFTNLTQDHLDFHGSMEAYFAAKRLLFVGERAGAAAARSRDADANAGPPGLSVINVDDPYGGRLAAEIPDAVTFGIERDDVDYAACKLRLSAAGSQALLRTADGRQRDLRLPLPGRFNIANALGALAACHRLGCELDTLLAALARGVHVPGRLEPVQEGQDFTVLVDYAHTPDSLERALKAAREISQARVICVFGAGGDRDRGKRPLMGEIGAGLADVVLLTTDNPRSEDPRQIIEDVLSGVRASGRESRVRVTPDRGEAIGEAIALARRGDVVLIAGKGHEQGIELAGGVKIPFDDVAAARRQLRAHRCEAAA